jgi:O-antigen ligase
MPLRTFPGQRVVAPVATSQPVEAERPRYLPSRSHAVPMLQVFALSVMIFPADTVIRAIGAQGYVGALIGMFAFAAFVAATLLGFHNPLTRRHPIRATLCVLWLSVLISYVVMDRTSMTPAQLRGADRMLMQLAVITGVALVAAECLTSLQDMRRVLRALIWGGAFCGVVAALQFYVRLDVTPYLRLLPGFTLNSDNPALVARGALHRASGTTLTAIELGVVAGMLLPLAVWLGIYDKQRKPLSRWAPVALIALGVTTSVSRSAIIALALAFAVLVVLMPARQRLAALGAAPLAVVGVYMSSHGVIGTLLTFFAAGSSDTSVQARLFDYPEVERLVNQAPWLGHGAGTYMPVNSNYILDNQWLGTANDLGAVGIIALAIYFVVPFVSALIARRHSNDPEFRLLCAALAGPVLAAAACSATFDSLSFPTFSNVYALVIGMIGACWRLAARGDALAPERAGPPSVIADLTGRKPVVSAHTIQSAGG